MVGSANLDGPLIVSGLSTASNGQDADVRGTIIVDRGCLQLQSEDGQSFAIAWPEGTSWKEHTTAVELKDGRLIRPGDSFEASGGYYETIDIDRLGQKVSDAAQQCEVEEIIVLNGETAGISTN